jgi:cell division protein FtsI (penicillin-binding protein 3)
LPACCSGRAVYIQIIGTDFYQKEGEKRFAHTLEVPASRGRVLDRNGLVLATSVPVPSRVGHPQGLPGRHRAAPAAGRLLGMPPAELDDQRWAALSATSPGCARQVDEPVWDQVKALNIKGVYQSASTSAVPRRRIGRARGGLHQRGETGQEGIELRFQNAAAGADGSRTVVRDRLGRVVEDMGDAADPVNGRDIQLSIDSKVQFFAYQRVRDAVAEHNAKAGSVVVLDVQTGEVLALANYPSYDPGERARASPARSCATAR